eukprot:CAMPEP_0198242026 /NCGR_PEP_ID=MMETSP1446-20131203/9008_1 /TAXON_ID=1461542 ORGANISM="Unidentified sp, Strain CCMP2111" /NCGR_SAMPLE_ID=MMETSP1446 /ASSEMBLY_ACC=CAM_ASM_001112 /LENGTH=177 /DNA_ID=CAMNT_0043925145 /DNA_START=113 /DNA_END=643 /DNA_ORIENTATION=-
MDLPEYNGTNGMTIQFDEVDPEEIKSDDDISYTDKLHPMMLKIDWRFPRPGLFYPVYSRTKFKMSWNAVKCFREQEANYYDSEADEVAVYGIPPTFLSLLSYAFMWLWFAIPTPVAFVVNQLVIRPITPVIYHLHKQVVLATARLGAVANKVSGKGDYFSLKSALEMHHGTPSIFEW